MSRSCSPIRGHARATRRARGHARVRARARGGVPRGHARVAAARTSSRSPRRCRRRSWDARRRAPAFSAGKAFELDEASYARHGEATALELKKDTRTRAEASEKGKGGEKPSEAFDHVFPAHPYAWQNVFGAQNGAKGDVHETTQNPTNAQETFVRRAGDVTDSSDARCGPRSERVSRLPRPPALATPPTRCVPTERDLVCESKWRPVYRFVVVRRSIVVVPPGIAVPIRYKKRTVGKGAAR